MLLLSVVLIIDTPRSSNACIKEQKLMFGCKMIPETLIMQEVYTKEMSYITKVIHNPPTDRTDV